MKKTIIFLISFLVLSSVCTSGVKAATYYIAPDACEPHHTSCNPTIGNDTYTAAQAQNPTTPWATIGRAWNRSFKVQPGDVVVLLDGVYYETINPAQSGSIVNGTAAAPITVKAANEGMAVIDGLNQRTPIALGSLNYDYWVFEGLVARNGWGPDQADGRVIDLYNAQHITFRKVTGYNASTETNSMVFMIGVNSDYALLEDCVAVGSGRKMIGTHQSNHSTIRRSFTYWTKWDGTNAPQEWPWGENLDLYISDYNLLENNIGYSSVPRYNITIRANQNVTSASNNELYGNMAVYAGLDRNKQPMNWPNTRPACTGIFCATGLYTAPYAEGYRVGLKFFGPGILANNKIVDLFAYGNASYGVSVNDGGYFPKLSGLTMDHWTITQNSRDQRSGYGGGPSGTDMLKQDYDTLVQASNNGAITNSSIDRIWDKTTNTSTSLTGSGARLRYRYVNGTLTGEELWPWPMENRIKAEMARYMGINNFSVTCEIGKLVHDYTAQKLDHIDFNAYCNGTAPNPTVAPTANPTPTPIPGDANNDNRVDGVDYMVWRNNHNTAQSGPSRGDFNNNGYVDNNDYTVWQNNYRP